MVLYCCHLLWPQAFSDRGDSGAMILLEESGSTIETLPDPEHVDVEQGTHKLPPRERHGKTMPGIGPKNLPEARQRPSDAGPLWRPLALTWAFSGQVGRSHYGDGLPPSFWSGATDLGRVLKRMHLDLVL